MLVFSASFSFAKDFTVTGKVIDKSTNKPLKSASISVQSKRDTTLIRGEYTDKDGKFKIENLPMGGYNLKITFVGYITIYKNIMPAGSEIIELGTIEIEPDAVKMKSVEVVDNMIRAEIKGDTTEFNSGAIKTQPNAVTEELVKKIPGVQVESSGNIKAHGEDVKEVLVNGRQYFGDDPMMAMRNIPAEVIDKVQIFDKMSDQAEFSGFDDGTRYKAMNLLTKGGTLGYGKIYGGYGYQDKYTAGGSYTMMKGDMRLSILGMSNNINQQNFNFQDIIGLFGSGGRMSAGRRSMFQRISSTSSTFVQRPSHGPWSSFGSFFVGNLGGLTTTHATGINYSDKWGEKFEITGSYFVNYTDNNNQEDLNRQYYIEGDTNFFYRQISDNLTHNLNQRINGKITWDLDSSNSFIIRPRANIQSTDYIYNQTGTNLGQTLIDMTTDSLNSANSKTNSDYSGYNISNEVLYRHKFAEKGRTFSFEYNNAFNDNSGDTYLNSLTSDYFNQYVLYDSVQQLNNNLTHGYSHSGRAMFTEPLGDMSQLSLSYYAEYSRDNEDRSLFSYNELTGLYDKIDSALTNFAVSKTINQKVGLGYRLDIGKFELNTTLNYQFTNFENDKTDINPLLINRDYNNFLPYVRMSYKFSKATDLRMHFYTSTQIPSISQLSSVVDNSNPLQITTGNPELEQQLSYTLFSRLFTIFNDNRNSFFLMTYLSYTDNYISNQTFIAQGPMTINGYEVMKGAQIIIPGNFGRQLTSRTYSTFSMPLDFIKSTLNTNLGFTYTETPGLVNHMENTTENYAYTSGLDLNSNISENLDFSIGISGTINDVSNTVQQALNSTYYSLTSFARFNLTLFAGFFVNLDFNYLYTTGYSDGYNQDLFITNFGLGNRALYKNNFDLKFQVFDIFDQTKSISRNVTDSYFEDINTLALKRYGLLTLTYYIRPF